MVVKDTKSFFKNTENSKSEVLPSKIIANPLDRLAAAVIDFCIIIPPVFILSVSPVKRFFFQAAIQNHDLDLIYASIMMMVLFVALTSLYQVLMIYYFGATVGQLYLGLRVQSIWGEKRPSWLACWQRCFAWWVSHCFLGFSFLGLFSQKQRRCFHDRVSDSVVVSLKLDQDVGEPSFTEKYFSYTASAFILSLIILFVSLVSYRAITYLSSENYIAMLLGDESSTCQTINDSVEQMASEGQLQEMTRLELAMSLFAIDAIGPDCLNNEANFIFKHSQASNMAYLARLLVYKAKPKLANSYQQKICAHKEKSPECDLTDLLLNFKNEKATFLVENILESSQLYLKLWGLKYAEKLGDYEKIQSLAKTLPDLFFTKNVKYEYKIKSQWALDKKNMALASSEVIYDMTTSVEHINLVSWMCNEQATKDCHQEKPQACKLLSNYVQSNPVWFSADITGVGYVNAHYCDKKVDERVYSYFSKDLKKYQTAVKLIKSKNKDKARESLWRLVNNEKVDLLIRNEAELLLVNHVTDLNEMTKFRIHWLLNHIGYQKQKIGQKLFAKFFDLKEYQFAFDIAKKLNFKYLIKPKEITTKLAYAAFRSGNQNMAKKWLAQYNSDESRSLKRAPASESYLQELNRELYPKRLSLPGGVRGKSYGILRQRSNKLSESSTMGVEKESGVR